MKQEQKSNLGESRKQDACGTLPEQSNPSFQLGEKRKQDACDTLKSRSLRDFAALVFFDPYSDIEIKERNLPHWHQGNTVCFVTFHLADSIPKEKAEEIRKERELWELNHKEPYTEQDLKDFYRLFSERIEKLLNAGHGSCCLADEANAKIIADTILHFNRERYLLDEWVIMPNHVHVIIKPLGDNKLSDILHSWKSYTAKAINKRTGQSGQFWMHESYDHIVRNQKSLLRIREYIRNNPSKARVRGTQASSLEKTN